MHGGTGARLSVRTATDRVWLEVADGSTAVPVAREDDLGAQGGRGLALVDALATRWGVRERPDGKDVWAEVAATG